MDTMLSEKGKHLFVVNDFKFDFHKKLDGGVERRRCTKRGCTAFLKVEGGIIVKKNLIHDTEKAFAKKVFANPTHSSKMPIVITKLYLSSLAWPHTKIRLILPRENNVTFLLPSSDFLFFFVCM